MRMLGIIAFALCLPLVCLFKIFDAIRSGFDVAYMMIFNGLDFDTAWDQYGPQ